jgi:hypothetical protein
MSGIGEAQDALVEDVRNHYDFDLGTEFPIIIVNGDWRLEIQCRNRHCNNSPNDFLFRTSRIIMRL